MKRARPRTYNSPARQRQADETRRRIVASTRKLLMKKGFAGTTIEQIARDADVSMPTVYSVFGSKEGIVAEILNAARFGVEYEMLTSRVHETKSGRERLRAVAAIARQVYESERAEIDLLRGAGVVSPELAASENEAQERRFAGQVKNAQALHASGELRADLDRRAAAEILWALTSRDFYRMLVVERGWSAKRYETWLGELMIDAVLAKKRTKLSSRA